MNTKTLLAICLISCCLSLATVSSRVLADEVDAKPSIIPEVESTESKTEVAAQAEEQKPTSEQEVANEPNEVPAADISVEPETAATTQKEENETTVVVPPVAEKEATVDSEANTPVDTEEKKEEEQATTVIQPIEEVPAAEEKKESATTKELGISDNEEDELKKGSNVGSMFSSLLLICGGVLIFFVSFYRYSLNKYHIPPFTPPSFCPNLLFPRPENDRNFMEDYITSNSGFEMGISSCPQKYQNFV